MKRVQEDISSANEAEARDKGNLIETEVQMRGKESEPVL